jgi:MFS family permease
MGRRLLAGSLVENISVVEVAMQTPPPPPSRAPPSRQSTVRWDFVDEHDGDDGEVENDEEDHDHDDDDDEDDNGEGFTPVIANSTRKRRLLDNNNNNSDDNNPPSEEEEGHRDHHRRYRQYTSNRRHEHGHDGDYSPATVGESAHSSNWGSFYFQNHHPPAIAVFNNNHNATDASIINTSAIINADGNSSPLPPHIEYWMQMGTPGSKSSVYGHQHVHPTTTMIRQSLQYNGNNMQYISGNDEQDDRRRIQDRLVAVSDNNNQQEEEVEGEETNNDELYTIYPTRYVMLAYISILNLLSDWTCYSMAPMARLTKLKFGESIDPEGLVTVFLLANTVSTILEPAILGRLGLRRTILVGSVLLMCGSMVKSSGALHAVSVDVEYGHDRVIDSSGGEGNDDGNNGSSTTYTSSSSSNNNGNNDGSWRLYLGFFLVGLSQPLYQCTPALLSASWFPEHERTMATGVALNSNQLGIGCAFIFGTMLVTTEDDILPYFGLLSLLSTITFVGVALQFDDAPPTPPSNSARVIRGDLEIKVPRWLPTFVQPGGAFSWRRSSVGDVDGDVDGGGVDDGVVVDDKVVLKDKTIVIEKIKKRKKKNRRMKREKLIPPSLSINEEDDIKPKMMQHGDEHLLGFTNDNNDDMLDDSIPPPLMMSPPDHQPNYPPPPLLAPPLHYYHAYPPGSIGHTYPPSGNLGYTTAMPSFYHGYDQDGHYHNALLETSPWYDNYRHSFSEYYEDEGAEPIMTQLDHHLDIDIRDDQIIQQFKACFRRKGFSHCVVAFTTSGVIINTLSTFMDYLVTLNGAGREYVGIVGGTFQMLIMCSSLVFGGWTDASRKYYLMTLVMLTFGTFALSVCNVNLDANAGGDLRWSLLVVAILAGPLQPISTELGVEVIYPLSENTVLVIQQLFSNLLSALFIPLFKALRDVRASGLDESENNNNILKHIVPHYTFSFYLLIVIFALATCYFATFNGMYLRYEAEEAKKAKKEEEESQNNLHHYGIGYGSLQRN